MNKIKQALYAVTSTALALAPLTVGAATADSTGFDVSKTKQQAGTLGSGSIFALVSTVMNWLLGLIGVLAVVAFVISGILYLTAAGDEEQIERAKSTMMFAIIGLVVALVGLVIVNAVGGITGGNNNAGNF
jgi:cytochrome bd-type quinol oxidase subunit 2